MSRMINSRTACKTYFRSLYISTTLVENFFTKSKIHGRSVALKIRDHIFDNMVLFYQRQLSLNQDFDRTNSYMTQSMQ